MERLEPNPRYAKMSPNLLSNFSLPIMVMSGSMTDWNGMSIAATNMKNRKELVRFFVRTIFHPAMDAKTTSTAMDARVTRRLFANAFRK
jgi:hypothetical protein